MCDATSIAYGLAIVTGAVEVDQGNKAADVQTESLQRSADNASVGSQEQVNQETAKASDQISERVRQSLIERRRLEVQANEGGISGNTVDRITGISKGNEGRDIATIESNAASRNRQLQNEGRGIQQGFANRRSQVNRPNATVTGLQIASSQYTRNN